MTLYYRLVDPLPGLAGDEDEDVHGDEGVHEQGNGATSDLGLSA